MGRAGFELSENNPSQTLLRQELTANTKENQSTQRVHDRVHEKFTPDLQLIVSRWNSLPDHIKQAINALIKTS